MLKEVTGRTPIPKILDFGLAKLKTADGQKAMGLTQAHQTIGSPPYMSPEQVRGKPLDERSDIYSLGCTIFEALTGYTPFGGDTVTEVMFKHIEEAPLTFEEVQPELTYPEELKQLIAMALQKKPEDRFQTMRAMRDGLEELSLKLRLTASG